MKVNVTAEGRPGVWVPDRDSLIAWLEGKGADTPSHLLEAIGPVLAGFDVTVEYAVGYVRSAIRLGLTTGDAWAQNMRHALSVVVADRPGGGERLLLFDIGELDPVRDLEAVFD